MELKIFFEILLEKSNVFQVPVRDVARSPANISDGETATVFEPNTT